MRSVCPNLASRSCNDIFQQTRGYVVRASLFPWRIWTPRDAGNRTFRCSAWNPGEPVKTRISCLSPCSMRCVIRTFCQALDLAGIRCMRWSVPARTRSSSAAARVRTIREPIAPFSDLFYIGEGEGCTTSFSTRIWKIKERRNRLDFLKRHAGSGHLRTAVL